VGFGGTDWIDLARDRDRWFDLVILISLRVPRNAGKFLSG
jgi:hypothetical protein